MRTIPKKTKVKLQFYKNATITDVIIASNNLGFLTPADLGNLPNKWIVATIN